MVYVNFLLALLFLNNPSAEVAPGPENPANAFEATLESNFEQMQLDRYGLDFDAFRYAMIGYYNMKAAGKLENEDIITIIDFNKASTEKRFYTIDLNRGEVIFHSLVSHGQNTGGNYATDFSNTPNTNKSSMGFYLTAETYTGKHGHSLRLDGMDKDFNHNARDRAIVMHGADYVNESITKKLGRLGRSWGCPALPYGLHEEVIETIKNKSLIFAYYKSENYLQSSELLDINKALMTANNT